MTDTNQKKTAACLDGETLASFLDGTLDEPKRAEAEAHLGDCQECLGRLTSLQLLLSSIEEKPETAPDWLKVRAKNLRRTGFAPEPTRRTTWGERLSALFAPAPMKLAGVGIAAGIAFLAFFATLHDTDRPSPYGDVVRSGAEEQPGLALHQPDGGMTVSRSGGAAFSWAPLEKADRYIVRIYREDGSVAWKVESDAPSIRMSAEDASTLEAGPAYEWSVEAVLPFSESVRSSLLPLAVR